MPSAPGQDMAILILQRLASEGYVTEAHQAIEL